MLKPQFLFALALCAPHATAGGLLAIRVGRAETVAKGVIENAVILIEDGKIVTVGEDLPVERGVPILDRPEWTVTPGLVSCYTRIGQDSQGDDDTSAEVKARDELWPQSRDMRKVVDYGVTTLGIYPAGNGIPGQAVAIRPRGETVEELVLRESSYLKIVIRADSSSKKRLRDGFKKADDHAEKVKKAKEKWDKEQEKKKSAKKDDKKEEEKKEGEEQKSEAKSDAKSDVFQPPEPDEKVKAYVGLREGRLRAVAAISGAAEYLHWLDALGKEKIGWDLRLVLNQDCDFFYVLDKKTYELDVDGIGDHKARTIVEPVLTFTPNTRRLRNLPAEISRAGGKLCFTPRQDDLDGYKAWLTHVGDVVGAGLDRDAALRALTLEPAELLAVADRVGSIEKGKDANFAFFDGDPFQPATRLQAVMLDGRFVFGEVDQ